MTMRDLGDVRRDLARSLCGLLLLCAVSSGQSSGQNVGPGPQTWPAFRGTGDSLTAARQLPEKWSAESGVAWTSDLKGYGQSSPVVWADKVFVTAIDGARQETLLVMAFALKTGQKLWEKSLTASQTHETSDYVSKAAPTPAVDAQRLYVFFESGDLHAFTHAGEAVWDRSLTKEYGDIEGPHGLGSSPALTDGALLVLVDHSGPSYLLAVDPATGKNLWKTPRERGTTWSSPTVVRRGEQREVLISGGKAVDAYALSDGKKLWSVEGLDGNNVPSPTVSGDVCVIGAQEPESNLAIRLGGTGDVTASHVLWRASGASSSFGSPLVHRGQVYFVSKAGIAQCVDLQTGKSHWTKRLPGSCWASPLGAGDRVYFFTKDATTVVVKAGPELEEVAENRLDLGGRLYGVAVVDGAFVIRTGSKLACLGNPR